MRLLITPYNYAGHYGVSHSGLHISSLNTTKVLVNAGLDALMFPITGAAQLDALIQQYKPTHVVTCAFWLQVATLQGLLTKYPYITFAVNCHSNVAFLQAEPRGITMARNLLDLEQSNVNFHVSGNSMEFVSAVRAAWEAPSAYLPNLYYLDADIARQNRPKWSGGTLRIGAFGALRPLKNPTVSAMAALGIASNLGTNLAFYVNVGRHDGWGIQTLKAVEAIMANLPNATLYQIPWQDWPSHRRLVRSMHLMLQPSFSESFNLVTADGAAEGIASVVTDAIEWAPQWWKSSPETTDVIRTGLQLLNDSNTGRDGIHALQRNNVTGVAAWKRYLGVSQ